MTDCYVAFPAVVYAEDARGTEPPAFAILRAPMSRRHPEYVTLVARKPKEGGPDFYTRVVTYETHAMAHAREQAPEDLRVLFINQPPPVGWRLQQLKRYELHWRSIHSDTMDRIQACGELAGLYKKGPLQKVPTWSAPGGL